MPEMKCLTLIRLMLDCGPLIKGYKRIHESQPNSIDLRVQTHQTSEKETNKQETPPNTGK